MSTKNHPEGDDILAVDIDSEFADDTRKRIEKIGRKCVVEIVDVINSQEVNEMVDDAVKQFGKVNIPIKNAGVFNGASTLGCFQYYINTTIYL